MKNHENDERINNDSSNRNFSDILEARLSRRQILQGSLSAATLSMFGLALTGCDDDDNTVTTTSTNNAVAAAALLGFTAIPVSSDDAHHVPEGYTAKVLYSWGDPVSDGPAFNMDASNPANEQLVQAGMHHDGMYFFPLPYGSDSSDHGLLVMNHEYVDPNLLHTTGGYDADPNGYIKDKADKEMAAHGVSVIEIRKNNGEWEIVRPSSYARRVTMLTAMDISGPARSSRWMQTSADPFGVQVIGTMNNCAYGRTPWGTYLACEENFQSYFAVTDDTNLSDEQKQINERYGSDNDNGWFGWEVHDPRFDGANEPNEPNRFGWIVEIDPFNPNHKPVKRTALGRFRHECAALSVTDDDRVVLYSGDDARFEYIYKFVSNRAYDRNNRDANMIVGNGILDDGKLYVAKFNEDGSGEWILLEQGQPNLTAANGFATQADVLVKTRMAADAVGATKMDRPEWIAVHPDTKQVYATLTNNTKRTEDQVDAANPRGPNPMGSIIRWKENGDADATTFSWDIYMLAGNPDDADPNNQGNIKGDIFSSPDGIWIDKDGRVWIQTDMSGSSQLKGIYEPFGNNQMLASDPATGEVKRFFVGPIGQEVTGVITTPDGKTMFINIQHPGDVPGGLRDSLGASKPTPENPRIASNWPDFNENGRPRSSTIVITKDDGGVIGS
ncbi:PhoX family phosphatase [Candidatus Albibeggiatoa sp. nov. NOAA]|uniref:PhoX family protein n=1 Tax=Candidatus Albibeggiatoa sp. nov. NOAA TaxID=3162724 RepID=UPI00330506C3|nr:PhoX family phosphatase [Thiotrichaceae bacterium]